jgi:hypothetical protein
MDATFLQQIFGEHFLSYKKNHSLPLKQLKAAYALMSCRTSQLGSSTYQCPIDKTKKTLYHACRHRSCPQCAAKKQQQWCEKQQERLLNCSHYHCVFTIPHEYLKLWQFNTKWFTKTLFQTVKETLLELLEDPKYLGAKAGIIMALHTWGRQLNQHPHMHCLVTGGGVDIHHKWKEKAEYLLPIKVVKALYRGKLQSALLSALDKNELTIPRKATTQEIKEIIKKLYKKEWSVNIQEPYAYGDGVIQYLSRYICGGAIKQTQIKYITRDQIAFYYKDHRDGKIKLLTLAIKEFIRRVLWHTPDSGQHQIRHYGLYNAASKARKQAQKLLPKSAKIDLEKKPTHEHKYDVKCSHCEGMMVLVFITSRWSRKGNSLLIRTAGKNHGLFLQQEDERRRLNTVPP